MNGDTIKNAMFTGDFNSIPPQLAEFEAALKWTGASRERLTALAERTCGADTGLGVPVGDVVDAVLHAAEQVAARITAAPDIEGSCYFPERQGASP